MGLNLRVKDLVEATGGFLLKGEVNREVQSINTDSRKIRPGDFFVALKGEKFDGHDFIKEAIKKGAEGVILSKNLEIQDDVIIIKVNDTLKALQDIASYYRKKLNAKVIGITGSSGKTTTKTLIGQLLSLKGKVYMSRENFNNEIGVPLSILDANRDIQFLILEMAMRNKGEIRLLSKISEPDIGVITNIGWAHIGRLGSKEAIMEAKSEIFDHINPTGIGILNADDSFSLKIYERLSINKYTFGFSEKSDIKGSILEKDNNNYTLRISFPDKQEIKLKLPIYPLNIYRDLLAGIAVFWVLFPKEVKDIDLSNLTLPKQRLDVKITKNGFIIIDDTYNANPDSMKTAIEYLDIFETSGRKIVLLGDMLELGVHSLEGHKDVILELKEKNFDFVILYGEEMKKAFEKVEGLIAQNFFCTNDFNEIKGLLKEILKPSDVILVKGSRAMHMEDFVKYLEGIYE